MAPKHILYRLAWVWRVLAALVGGLLSSLAMPREGIWPLIFASVALLVLSVHNLRFRAALGIGFIGGLAYYLSQIEWLSLYLGPVPWLALSVLEAAIFAGGLAVLALVWRWLDQTLSTSAWKPILTALALALVWTAREWVAISLPYGGFPWSRLAQTQSESILSRWVYVGGLGWLTFLVALVGAALAVFVATNFQGRVRFSWVTPAASSLLVLALPLAILLPTEPENGTLVVGTVQGNAKAGLFANTERGTILNNHLDATQLLKENPRFNELDLVVWPENASDLSPFRDVTASQQISQLVDEELGVPLVFGTITERGEKLFNSSILWEPLTGPVDYYDKQRPVPFAEYVPDRDFWYQLAPDLIGLISRGYSFGERDGIYELPQGPVGTLICFEIAIDDIGRNLVNQGAQVILSQTNNADFGFSDETFQQAAFAKLRAIETGRAVVNVSTVGVTAVYGPDGQTLDQLETFTAGAMVTEVPLRTSLTPGVAIGGAVDLAINLLATLLTVLAIAHRYRTRKPKELA